MSMGPRAHTARPRAEGVAAEMEAQRAKTRGRYCGTPDQHGVQRTHVADANPGQLLLTEANRG